MKIRHVISYNGPDKPELIAEIDIPELKVMTIQTKLLLELDFKESLPTRVYWLHKGNPPKPTHIENTSKVIGTPVMEAQLMQQVNTKTFNWGWVFRLKQESIE